MKSFTATAVVLFASIMVATSSPGVRVQPQIEILPTSSNTDSHLPPVHGARQCGGPGKAVQFRYAPCTGEGICRVPGDGQLRQSELDFVPSQDSSALGIRIVLISDGTTKTVFEKAVANSAVQGREPYTVHATGGADKELKGKTVTMQYILYHVDDNHVEVCIEADFVVV